jgi:hypothetical protein
MDLLGSLGRDFLDVHPAFARTHEDHALRSAVDDHRDVKLLADVGALFDQQPAHFLSFRPGLVRFQLHAEDRVRVAAHLFAGLGDLDAAALAAAAGVDLRLHDPHLAAELVGRFHGLLDAEARDSARCRDTEFAEDFLRLVFVDLHPGTLRVSDAALEQRAACVENLTAAFVRALTRVKFAIQACATCSRRREIVRVWVEWSASRFSIRTG